MRRAIAKHLQAKYTLQFANEWNCAERLRDSIGEPGGCREDEWLLWSSTDKAADCISALPPHSCDALNCQGHLRPSLAKCSICPFDFNDSSFL